MSGTLYVVGTPLGNLGDLTPRAVEILRSVDVIACEDTRRAAKLLSAAAIARPELVVVNDHTELGVSDRLAERIVTGVSVALTTDAGMPAISDPGTTLVAACAAAGVEIVVVPGPSAVTTAVSGSGLPAGRFVFEGFLPRKGAARSERLDELSRETRTAVLYEAPHRAERTLEELREVCGADRPVAVARELTKLHESWYRGPLGDAPAWVADHAKGEFVIVLGGAAPAAEATDEEIRVALSGALAAGRTTRDAVAEVATGLGVGRRRVYDLALHVET